ncbi:MAG: 2-methylfumaryl-CoA isomerase [Gammaproteobacteria bacterium]|nr:2-methylfumaryl-CoA isomerase [Gammaproteobacteria bacterium]MYH45269.1 2-methylfumaryl-CoA isomerase [Gammaproteobacteria bacterium]MYL13809.1 2-methylfumaryl-CoA isomerase [Gammaproteobacteria bacterium]
MQAILKGMRVVEGSAFIAAPSGGMTLAQLGADVIRFDLIGGGLDYRRWPVDGKGNSLYWHGLNKGKRSIAIDFRRPEGQELLAELIARPGEDAGIFLSNFPARGWLADESLRARREDLIYLSLSGDRHGGSALDYTVNCRLGLPWLSAVDERPVNNPLPAWDLLAGQQIALGLLAAERHRRLTGAGQFVRIALADVALAVMGHLGYIAEVETTGTGRQPVGNHVFGSFGYDFACRCGRRVMIVGVSPRQWRAIVTVTGTGDEVSALEKELQMDFDREGDRFRARERLAALFAPWFAQRDFTEASAELDRMEVCWGPYQTVAELVEQDAECSDANPLFSRVEQPGIGNLLTPSQALQFGGLETDPPAPAPLLGQHTDEILTEELGLSAGEIAKLHDRGLVAGAAA